MKSKRRYITNCIHTILYSQLIAIAALAFDPTEITVKEKTTAFDSKNPSQILGVFAPRTKLTVIELNAGMYRVRYNDPKVGAIDALCKPETIQPLLTNIKSTGGSARPDADASAVQEGSLRNVLRNPGFEEGLRGWEPRGTKTQAVKDPKGAHSGNIYCLAGGGYSGTYQWIQVSGGDKIKLRFWIESRFQPGPTTYFEAWPGEGWSASGVQSNPLVERVEGDWQLLVAEMIIPDRKRAPEFNGRARVGIALDVQGQEYKIDDMSVSVEKRGTFKP